MLLKRFEKKIEQNWKQVGKSWGKLQRTKEVLLIMNIGRYNVHIKPQGPRGPAPIKTQQGNLLDLQGKVRNHHRATTDPVIHVLLERGQCHVSTSTTDSVTSTAKDQAQAMSIILLSYIPHCSCVFEHDVFFPLIDNVALYTSGNISCSMN